jgi:RNA polymerase sigma-70 factor (ECF subfamily)
MGQTGPIDDDADLPATEVQDRRADRDRDAEWVRQAVAGDADAFGRLYDAWFDRVHALVARIVRSPDPAADVCQDAFLSAWRGLPRLEDPGAFGGWLLRIARNAAYDRSAREGRSRPVDEEGLAVIERTAAADAAPQGFGAESRLGRGERPEEAAADAELAALVHEATAALSARDAEVLDLQLRADLTPAEIGQVLGVNRNAANQLCHRARQRFAAAFGARTLWHGDRPSCPELQSVLTTAGVSAFGADAVRLATTHAQDCAQCQERRDRRLRPAALFAGVPVLAAPAVMKAEVAAGLGSAGVPMGGSGSGSNPGGSVEPGDAGPGSTGGESGPSTPAGDGGATTASSGSAAPSPGGPDTTTAPDSLPAPPASGVAARHVIRIRRRIPGGGWRWTRVIVCTAAVTVVVLVLLGLFVLTRGDSDEVVTATDGGSAASSPTTDPSGTEGLGGSAGAPVQDLPPDPSIAPAPPTGGGPPPSPSPTTPLPPSEPTTTTTTTPPTPPAVALLTVDDGAPRPEGYPIATGPLLRWQVTGATSVQVVAWYAAPGNAPVRRGVVATGAAGTVRVCPGTPDAGLCRTPQGTYTFRVEATGPGGQTTTPATGAPGFDVYLFIS